MRRTLTLTRMTVTFAVAGTIGCSPPPDRDERLAEMAEQSVVTQSEQNEQIAEQSRQTAPAARHVPVEVDYSRPFSGSDVDAWEQEYLANVNPEEIQRREVNAGRVNGDRSIEMQPSQLDDPFFVGDEAEWLGLWSEPEPLGSE